MRQALFVSILAALATAISGPADARRINSPRDYQRTIAAPPSATDNPAALAARRGLAALSVTDTTWLYSANFNGGDNCQAQGWTSVDITAETADYWHVDDYAGLPFGPIAGAKSLWCGVRSNGGLEYCSYATLPGYGNSWNQRWCTKNCLTTAGGTTTNLDVSFTIRYDSEASYDGTSLEYTTDCSGDNAWTEIDGGIIGGVGWAGAGTEVVDGHYSVGPGPVKVRLRFTSDTAFSDQDGFYPTDGAAHIDNLKAEGLTTETFEDEAVGATSSNDWQSCNSAYGDNAILFKGGDLLQEDPCKKNLSCMWTFLKNSTVYYTCGGYPTQKVVPYVNNRGQYIDNEIWSPLIPLSGSGSTLKLRYDVYRDLPLDALIYYTWRVRTIVNGCPTVWKVTNFAYNGDDKQWFTQTEELGGLVNLTNATHIQVALGVLDMCPFHCGIFGTGQCHTPSPYFDNVKVFRVNVGGPQWSVRDIDLFQDTFASDGTLTGKGRADTAADIKPTASPSFTPGDSAIIFSCMDGNFAGLPGGTNSSGLSNDPNISTFIGRDKTKKAVYMWVAVWPQGQANKSGDGLSEGPGGQANRYPHIAAKDYVDANGVTWTAIRADFTYQGTANNAGNGHPAPNAPPIVANRFNVDLNDNVFTPGDTVCFFYGATSPGGTTYYSDQWHLTDNIAEVAANPMEFTVLPAGGFNRGGDILYVDGADGYGTQPYFDGAFLVLRLNDKVDRYDVRGPASGVSNTLSSRVPNIAGQLNAAYDGIIWDTGSLPITLGDGNSRKCDDYALFNMFLGNLTTVGGLYLGGDDMATRMILSPAASAVSFRSTYMPFTLASGDHIAAGLGVSPKMVHWPGRSFTDDFTVFGGCPEMNDFDVLNSFGTSRVEMSYNTAQSANGGVLLNTLQVGPSTRNVMLSGFSVAAVRDDETNGISDRAQYLRDAIVHTMSTLGQVTSAGPTLRNSLAQNYPNPFNPSTTISFSIKERGAVSLKVYDVSGALVRTLADETRAAGTYALKWDGRDEHGRAVASGVYFYRLMAGDFRSTKKMVLLK